MSPIHHIEEKFRTLLCHFNDSGIKQSHILYCGGCRRGKEGKSKKQSKSSLGIP